MLNKPGRFSRFWKELKRRNVHRSLAIYAGTAFIILEAATIIFPRWDFPDWTIDLVLYLLILGTFVTFIVSWIFDITPQGVQKTRPIEEVAETEKPGDSRVWKAATYISLLVIVALVIFNIVPFGKTVWAGDIQSLVILPFDNFTGDDQLEYFVSGMHASLIGDMGKIGGLRVISKTSSNTYKDVDLTIPEIASELAVDAVVETQVMCLGDTICLQVRVVTPFPEEKQLWASDYRVEKSQILNLYNRVTRQIADEVMIELSPNEERVLNETRTVNEEAYDAYLMGLFYWDKLSKDALDKALEYFNRAVEIDPDWAPAYSGLAQVWVGMAQMGFAAPEIAGPMIYENINKALELDPDFAASHYTLGIISVWVEWNWEKGEKEFLTALELNPSDAMSRIYYAHLLMILQRNDEALSQGQLAVDLDPLNPLVLALHAVVLGSIDQWDEAMDNIEKAESIDPFSFFTHHVMEIASFEVEDVDAYLRSVRFVFPFDEEVFLSIEKIAEKEGLNAAFEETVAQLESLQQSMFLVPIHMASRYVRIQQYNKAMDQVELGFEVHDQNIPYIAVGYIDLVPLFTDPRFLAIIEKLNLPMPAYSGLIEHP
jgi:TolB-like protein/Tfp pilus assembly protein PilF